MSDVRVLPDRTELIRKLHSYPMGFGFAEPGAVITEVSLRSVLIAANSFRTLEALTFDAHGFYDTAGGTYRLKFGGTTLHTIVTVTNGLSFQWRGLLGIDNANPPQLWFSSHLTMNDATVFMARNAVAVNLTINNILEITGQKTNAGHFYALESFIVAKHPRI